MRSSVPCGRSARTARRSSSTRPLRRRGLLTSKHRAGTAHNSIISPRRASSAARALIIQQAATTHGLQVAIHLEPYSTRSTTGLADINYLRAKGVSVFYADQATNSPSAFWSSIRSSIGNQDPPVIMFANGSASATKSGGLADFAARSGFDGIYTYDPLVRSLPVLRSTLMETAECPF